MPTTSMMTRGRIAVPTTAPRIAMTFATTAEILPLLGTHPTTARIFTPTTPTRVGENNFRHEIALQF